MPFEKDPNEVLDYSVNWTNWLGTDTISTSTWVVPTGITGGTESTTTVLATIWLSGGSTGSRYDLVNRIVTAGGRTADRTLSIDCRDR